MGVRIYKPTSAGRRNSSVNDYAEITHRHKNRPEKTLTEPAEENRRAQPPRQNNVLAARRREQASVPHH